MRLRFLLHFILYSLFAAFLLGSRVQVHASSPTVTPVAVAPIDALVSESSGLQYDGTSDFWTHNDGYGDNHLYHINRNGVVDFTLQISNAVNYDWEDLAVDPTRTHLYIGDFGNNDCDRTNLRVYRIPYPSVNGPASVTADVINFSYPDQQLIPSPWLNFDAEAFFHYDGNLYVFSKADSMAIGFTKLYRVPDQPGTYVATLVDSFYTNDRITSADINEDTTAVVLLANNRIHLFQGWSGDNFFTGAYNSLRFSTMWTQKEGITFDTRDHVWLSDEIGNNGNYLYTVDLSGYISSTIGIDEWAEERGLMYPQPAVEEVRVRIPGLVQAGSWWLYDMRGIKCREGSALAGEESRVEVSELAAGLYRWVWRGVDGRVMSSPVAVGNR